MTAAYLLIVNPRSANGSTGRRWGVIERRLRRLLPPFDVVFTEKRGHAIELAKGRGSAYQVVVAVGGDGTINEVVNGLAACEGVATGRVALGVIPRGTGSDFVRTVGIPHNLSAAARVLAQGRLRRLDLGRVDLTGRDGRPLSRLFINEGEVGMGAAVSDTVNRSSKRLGAVSFWLGILTTMVRYRDRGVTLRVDEGPPQRLALNNMWVANGRYSGGGMRSAPQAEPDDGVLDVVVVRRAGPVLRARTLLMLRSGRFAALPHVSYTRGRRIEVTASTPVPVEVEGELIGYTPAVFGVLAAAISVVSPSAPLREA